MPLVVIYLRVSLYVHSSQIHMAAAQASPIILWNQSFAGDSLNGLLSLVSVSMASHAHRCWQCKLLQCSKHVPPLSGPCLLLGAVSHLLSRLCREDSQQQSWLLAVLAVIELHGDFRYTHRVGRTGRAGHSGTALTLLTPEDKQMQSQLQALLPGKSCSAVKLFLCCISICCNISYIPYK